MVQILVVLILLGLLLYILSFLPIDPTIKKIINAAAIVLVLIWILGLFFPSIWNPGVPFRR